MKTNRAKLGTLRPEQQDAGPPILAYISPLYSPFYIAFHLLSSSQQYIIFFYIYAHSIITEAGYTFIN